MAAASHLEALALLPAGELARKWRCPRCDVSFPLDVAVCGGCGGSSCPPRASELLPKNESESSGLKMVAWRCRSCRHHNDISEAKCAGCDAERPPLPRPSSPKPTAPTNNFDPFSWCCPDCSSTNAVRSESCDSCGQEAPFLPENKEEPKERKRRKKLEAWICEGCRSTQPVGHVRCNRCGHNAPRLPDVVSLRKMRREVQKLRKWTQDLCLKATNTEFECPVCLETIAPSFGCRLRSCGDPLCKTCLADLVAHSDGRVLKCPVCPVVLDNRDTRNAVSPEVWERYVRLCLRRQAMGRPFSFNCTALDCEGRLLAKREVLHSDKRLHEESLESEGRLHEESLESEGRLHEESLESEGRLHEESLESEARLHVKPLESEARLHEEPQASGRVASCPKCHLLHCLACRASHVGRSCAEHTEEALDRLQRDVTEARFLEMKRRGIAMDCPACCAFLEKSYGCDWMLCPVCDTEVCWATKGPRWGPKGKGDISGGCRCRVNGVPCAPSCISCHGLLPTRPN